MNFDDTSWKRLAALARSDSGDRGEEAPLGFSTRVVARAWSDEVRPRPLFAAISLRLSLRALGASGVLAVAALAASYPTLIKVFTDSAPVVAVATEPASVSPVSSAGDEIVAPAASESAPESSSTSEDPVAEVVGMVS